MTVAVSRTLPLDRVSAIKDAVAAAIRKQMPGAEPTVTTDPVALDNESVLDRVMVIARNRALAVHHVTVHEIEDRLAISLDLEVDGKLSLREAHELADGLESAIAAELGASVEIDTHIEPIAAASDASGREAPPERVKAVEIALTELAADGRTIRGVHDVRVRETDDGEIVNFHCDVDPDLSVQAVHEKVDALERALRAAFALDQARDRPRRADEMRRRRLPIRTGHPRSMHAHRHRPADPPQGLPPARLAGGDRRARCFAAPDANKSARDARAQAQPGAPAAPLVLDGDGLMLIVAQARRRRDAGGKLRRDARQSDHCAAAEPAVHAGDRNTGRSDRQHASFRACTARAALIARNAKPRASAASHIFPTAPT